MHEHGANMLLEHLYGQLDMLTSIDLTDAETVENACKVNRAVNSTASSIIDMVEMSLRAFNARPGTVSSTTVRGFFDE